MNTTRRAARGRCCRAPLASVVLFLALTAVLFAVLPHLALADEPAGRSYRTIVGRIADVLGDTVPESGAEGPAHRHTRSVGGPPQAARRVSDGHPSTIATGGTP
ncbi:hypothetical protein Snoj_34590 [Streptomyces nojiriensis]|uniref:Secreted protein n=1 Tax=Streptomyces nojiriensis TaxID=66374 RepID=A0ABQ3SN35_9ACTN|nr:hypothetical protein [Streptomyces nojiriensis]QTI43105.1 hypothetical protein JYK04_00867 [Streptomyces nojiriensis]GGS30913.1 hypothetical protein GCM10010205_71500 [Streptomyces nojiriensis]GHI69541.1 hypothetical protein Snoj_34590 [Streptomyces nojiriensis]